MGKKKKNSGFNWIEELNRILREKDFFPAPNLAAGEGETVVIILNEEEKALYSIISLIERKISNLLENSEIIADCGFQAKILDAIYNSFYTILRMSIINRLGKDLNNMEIRAGYKVVVPDKKFFKLHVV